MNADDLMARINEAKSRQQEAQSQLSEVSGALKGVSVATEIERLGNRISEFSRTENAIANEARSSLQSPQMEHLRRAHTAGEVTEVQIGGRSIIYEPDLAGFGASAMSLGDGFALAPRAFSSQEELTKTFLHELHRLHTSNVRNGNISGPSMQDAVRAETDAAYNFANQAYASVSERLSRTSHMPQSLRRFSDTVVSGLESAPIRGLSRALGPLGAALDTYSLHEAYEADGGRMGENFKETAGGVVGGIAGGAAVGAAMGSVVPGVGTVVGGIVGGILGSMGGEWLGEKL